MAFFNKKKRDTSGPPSRQFYVEFLGWLPCKGIRGNIYTNAIAHELIQRKSKFPDVPKMTLQVSPNEIKISNDNSEEHRKEKITSVKYPCITMMSVMFATCMNPPNADIANCIYVAYNPITKSMLHTHVYRFDSPSTASAFVELLNNIVETPQHQAYVNQMEEKLRHDGFLQPIVESPPPDSIYLHKPPLSVVANAPPEELVFTEPEPSVLTPEMQSMQAIASELNEKFRLRSGPLLLPPKDYDTVHRKHGRLDNIASRKCLNEVYVGRTAIEAAALNPGNGALLEEEADKEQNDPPVYYPAKLSPEPERMPSPTTQGPSPPIMRRDKPRGVARMGSSSSFFSNSSGGSDRNRRSYTNPSQSSPPPVTNRGHLSSYENYPTLKLEDRSPLATSSPDMPRWDPSHKSVHTRQSSVSSNHSGLSSHSDPSQKMLNESELEIPPDYDEAPQNPEIRMPKDANPDYSNRRSFERQNYYDYHRGPELHSPNMVNAYPPQSPTHRGPEPYHPNMVNAYPPQSPTHRGPEQYNPNMMNAYPPQSPTHYSGPLNPSDIYSKPMKPIKAIPPLQR